MDHLVDKLPPIIRMEDQGRREGFEHSYQVTDLLHSDVGKDSRYETSRGTIVFSLKPLC